MICGWQAVITTGARNSSPLAVATPTALPFFTSTLSTGVPTRMSAPNDSAEARIASDTAPMPPSGMPQDATWPSLSSPVE